MLLSITVIITLIITFMLSHIWLGEPAQANPVSFDMACSVVNTFQWYLEGKIETKGNVEEESHVDLGKRTALAPAAVFFKSKRRSHL